MTSSSLTKAASIILYNVKKSCVLLLKRSKKASFFPSNLVFPGGIVDSNDVDNKFTALRELYEETGILLTSEENITSSLSLPNEIFKNPKNLTIYITNFIII